MELYVTGSNIFNQWLCDDFVINEFRICSPSNHKLETDGNRTILLQINWSYNILQINDTLHISGAWDGKENQFIKVPLPNDCVKSKEELCITGNDYKIIVVDKKMSIIWVLDLKTKEFKNLNFLIEEPIEDGTKKKKLDDNVSKVILSSDSCLYLTQRGYVYSGILPSYVDTGHCTGKVIDVQCGYEHFILLTEEGRVYTWGNGRRLQLGHGDISSLEIPTEVNALAGIKIIKISAGGWHSLALSEFGDVYAWGLNDTGQQGIKHLNEEHNESFSVPTLVSLFDEQGIEITRNVKDIACGSKHSALLLDDNTVWTAGCNKYGQLGISEQKYPSSNYFRNVFQCDKEDRNYSLICGPWNTVICCTFVKKS
ncbi:unnamed protein product [Spodoptera littoralis]|uniref:RCC1 domain-containing protein 1 n=1 Tax=Spodoptera littoralis TaxID=7109 RepID=A0A9P0IAD7_SPOLI|nr:unnamed protein product [Spodoptera littoralis]CAH1643167.1 unnamed protein product [Spodoptera littoralis]